METQIERRRRTLTPDDIRALVDAMETRAVDRLEHTVGRALLHVAMTWALRLVFIAIIYNAGAAGVLRHMLA